MKSCNGSKIPEKSENHEFLYPSDHVPFFPFRIMRENGNKIIYPVTGNAIQLNESAGWILDHCDGYHTWYEIVLQTAKTYKANYREIRQKAETVIDDLTNNGFIWWRKNRMNYYQIPPPLAVLWDLTSRCNLKCHHCVVDSGPERDDQLSLEKCLNLLDELANFGVQQLIFSGGEPLIRNDFFTIAEYAVKLGFTVQLATNATLITESVAKKIAGLGLHPQISLDGRTPETHEQFRNKKGSWNKTIAGIKFLANEGVKVSVAAVVTRMNVDEIPELYRFAKELGTYSFRIMPFVSFGRGRKFSNIEIQPSRMKQLTVDLLRLNDELHLELIPMEFQCTLTPPSQSGFNAGNYHIGCDGAIAYCTITAKGEVLPCNFFEGVDALNVNDKPFSEIWNESKILNYFRSLEVGDISGNCRNCSWLPDCRCSCIAANFAAGKMFESNIHCWLNVKNKTENKTLSKKEAAPCT